MGHGINTGTAKPANPAHTGGTSQHSPLCTITDSIRVTERTNSPLGVLPLSAPMSSRRFKNLPGSLPMYPHDSTANGTNPESSKIWHILPEPRGPRRPRDCRSPTSFLDSLSSLRLCRYMRNYRIHCRKLEPLQHRHDVALALAFHDALLSGQGPVATLRHRLAAAGRDNHAQGVCQVTMARNHDGAPLSRPSPPATQARHWQPLSVPPHPLRRGSHPAAAQHLPRCTQRNPGRSDLLALGALPWRTNV